MSALCSTLAVAALAQLPAPVAAQPRPADVAAGIYRALGLEVRLGDSWLEAVPELGGQRCTSEDDPLFSAMDCFTPLSLGPFGPDSGARSDGFTVYSYTERTVDRIAATQTHREDCQKFQAGVARALSEAGVPSQVETLRDGVNLHAGTDEVQLEVDCDATSQTLALSPSWIHLVPQGRCPSLAWIPDNLHALVQEAMRNGTSRRPGDLGFDCNVGRAELVDYAALVISSAQLAHASAGLDVPPAPPVWVVDQIRRGLASAQQQGARLQGAAARHFAAYLSREASDTFLDALWSHILHAGAGSTGARVSRSSSASSTGRSHHRH